MVGALVTGPLGSSEMGVGCLGVAFPGVAAVELEAAARRPPHPRVPVVPPADTPDTSLNTRPRSSCAPGGKHRPHSALCSAPRAPAASHVLSFLSACWIRLSPPSFLYLKCPFPRPFQHHFTHH